MTIETEFDPRTGLRSVRMCGCVTVAEFDRYKREVRGKTPTFRVTFVDLSRLERCEVGFESILPHAELVSAASIDASFSEVFLAPNDLAFGLARIYASVVSDRFPVQIFREAKAAHEAVQRALRSSDSAE